MVDKTEIKPKKMELSDYDSPADDAIANSNVTESAATSDDRVIEVLTKY